jgi:hypothetical protein
LPSETSPLFTARSSLVGDPCPVIESPKQQEILSGSIF